MHQYFLELTSDNPHEATHHHDESHMRHCFDYLRQSLMCASDTTLEPLDPELGGVTGWGVMRKCRDYQTVINWAEAHRASNEKGYMHDES